MTPTEGPSRGTPSPLGDALRALALLRPTDDTSSASIVRRLGLRARLATPAMDDRPLAVAPDILPADDVRLAPPRVLDADAGDALPALRKASLEPLASGSEAAPAWLADVPQMPVAAKASNPFRGARESLFEPKWQRTIVTRIASTLLSVGTLDMNAVITAVASARPIARLPRTRIRTAVNGVRVLIDESDSMQPFRQDATDLVRTLQRVIGPSRLRVEGFQGLPTFGVSSGLDWTPYRPAAPGMATVVVSDLGLAPRAPVGSDVGFVRWRRFLRDLGRGGQRATVVVPRDLAALPPTAAPLADFVAWDRATSKRRPTGAERSVPPSDANDDDSLAFPDAATATLVCACALAARVEPNLLRALRLAIGPSATVTTEARVWLGPWSDGRASTGLVVRRELREALLGRLLDDRPTLQRAWAAVEAAHVDAPPAIRMEEALVHHWLIGDEAATRAVLRSMVATLVDPRREGVWRWASGALGRLPRDLMRFEEGRMLAVGTTARSGDAEALRHLPRGTGSGWHWLEPAARSIEIGVTLREGTIEFGPVTARDAMPMQVPDGAVAIVEITPIDADHAAVGDTRHVRVDPRRRTLVPIDGDAFEVDVVGGGRYLLRSDDAPRSIVDLAPMTRRPRVQIGYAVEWNGATQQKELPFVIGILADVAGWRSSKRALEDRKFAGIDVDNFEAVMASIGPRLIFEVPNLLDGSAPLSVDLAFARLDAFLPAAIARAIPATGRLLATRDGLQSLRTLVGRSEAIEHLLDDLLAEGAMRAILADAPSPDGAGGRPGMKDVEFRGTRLITLLERADRTRGAEAWPAFRDGLQILARHLLSPTKRPPTAAASIEEAIAAIDRRLSAQISLVLHHPDLQALEGSWRGIRFLVERIRTDATLKLRLLDVAKSELAHDLRNGPRDGTTLHRLVVEDEFGQLGGEPYGCLIGDYHFDHRAADVQLLTQLAGIASDAQAPLIVGASPALLNLSDWTALGEPRDLEKVVSQPEYVDWRALRESEEARYVGLALPRFLARVPYGARTDPQEEFAFEEALDTAAHGSFTWINAAYAMGFNVARAFAEYGWVARIRGFEGGGLIDGLPVHAFATDDGGVDPTCPTEIAISDRREFELGKLGLMALMHRRNTSSAAFLGAQSLHAPAFDVDPDRRFNASLAARLPYVFAACRFTHYVRTLARDRIGSFMDPKDLERFLNDWILQYVDGDPEESAEMTKVQKPLADGRIAIGEPDGESWIAAEVAVRPHYQLEGWKGSLTITTRLPFAGRMPRTSAVPPELA